MVVLLKFERLTSRSSVNGSVLTYNIDVDYELSVATRSTSHIFYVLGCYDTLGLAFIR